MSSNWSNFEDESEEEITNRVMTFTIKYEFDSESSDEDISDQELTETYKLLYTKWKESCMVGEKQKKTISALLQEKEKLISINNRLKEEVTLLNSKLENMIKFVRMLNNGSNMLDEIPKVGKMSRHVSGI